MLKTHDALGRAFPNQLVLTDDSYTLGDPDIYSVLEPLNLHGPLYTAYLEAFQSFFRNTPRFSRERPSNLSRSKRIRYEGEIGGPVLFRPAQQFPEHEKPVRTMSLRYDLTPRGKAILVRAGRKHAINHGGWFEHQTANACISASLHLSALHAGTRFYTPDEIAGEDIGRVVPYELKGTYYENHRLVPDYLFGIDRYYAVETDLGNEVGRAEEPHRRKTYERMVLQYLALIGDKTYHEAYKIPANKALLVLFVTTQKSKLDLMESIIKEKVGTCNFILMKHIPAEAFSAYHSPKPLDLWTTPWKRVGRPDFYINNPERQ